MNAKRNEFSAGEGQDVRALMQAIGARARAAAAVLANASTAAKDRALRAAAAEIRRSRCQNPRRKREGRGAPCARAARRAAVSTAAR